MVCRPSPGDDVVGHAVSVGRERVYCTTLHAAVRVTADGTEVWRSGFEPRSDRRHGHRPGCALSSDERVLWVYRPDAMAGRDGHDQSVALDAATGPVVAQAELPTVGHGHEFMTVHHEQADGALRTCPEGEVRFTLSVAVTLGGETADEQEWFRHYRVDVRSGRVGTEFAAHTDSPYDVQSLGNGTWLTTDPSGHPVRWTDS